MPESTAFVTGESDPNDFTAAEVKAHLATADATEFARVIDSEKAGQNRVTVVGFTQDADQVEPDEDGYTRVVISS